MFRAVRTRAHVISAALLLAGLLGLLAGDDSAFGGQKKSKGAQKATGAALIEGLNSAKVLLEKANHDYKGHRHEAVVHLIHAVHLLEHQKAHPKPEVEHLKKPHWVKEPQPQSDMQLQEAQRQLLVIDGQWSAGMAEHHQKAHKQVKSAIQEIGTALKII